MAKLSHQTLVLATVISAMALLSEPCSSKAIPVRNRPGHRNRQENERRRQPEARSQPEARTHHERSQEIQVYVPAVPQGSIHGPRLQGQLFLYIA